MALVGGYALRSKGEGVPTRRTMNKIILNQLVKNLCIRQAPERDEKKFLFRHAFGNLKGAHATNQSKCHLESQTMPVAESLPKKYPLTITHFNKMIEIGILDEEEHIELIEGELILMAPIGPIHAGKTNRLNRLFSLSVGDSAIVEIQGPIVLDAHSEPEPDLALLRPRQDFYETANPTVDDVLLLVEIADSSLNHDKNTKIPIYARHRIPEVWLINLPKQQVEIYLKPSPEGYRHIWLPEKHECISPTLLPEVSVKISDIFS